VFSSPTESLYRVTITEDALPYFRAKRIRIFAHYDQAGEAAAERWTAQLKETATVDRLSFKGLSQYFQVD
jgi:hypothetical protein